MQQKIKAVFNWSGGKDSALALQKAIHSGEYEIVSLLTTVNRDSKRSTMHAIPLSVLHRQAESLSFPLYVADMIPEGEIGDYENTMRDAVEYFKSLGVSHFIFGDIFLHDVKSYREKQLAPHAITVVEPLWGKTSPEIMDDFLASGLKTVVVTTMADVLGENFIGRLIDQQFVVDLPEGCDPCGENGEYHTFCYDGDIFAHPVDFSLGTPFHRSFPIKMEDGTQKEYAYWFANIEDK